MARKEGLSLNKSVARAAVTEVLGKRRAKLGFGYANGQALFTRGRRFLLFLSNGLLTHSDHDS
jgi:hypothetical protein